MQRKIRSSNLKSCIKKHIPVVNSSEKKMITPSLVMTVEVNDTLKPSHRWTNGP